jgi:hypothetical protein
MTMTLQTVQPEKASGATLQVPTLDAGRRLPHYGLSAASAPMREAKAVRA